MNKDHLLSPIGYIKTSFGSKHLIPRQGILIPSSVGQIKLVPEISPETLKGLDEHSHAWIIWHFSMNKHYESVVKPPRAKGKSYGVFATRSPHRPNGLGLSLVRIQKVNIETATIEVSGVDLADGTPIFDIKPYLTIFECIPQSSNPEWINTSSNNKISDEELYKLANIYNISDLPLLREVLTHCTPGEGYNTVSINNVDIKFWYESQEIFSEKVR